jgi:hypothetical protein
MNLDEIPEIYPNESLHKINYPSSSILQKSLKNTVNDYVSYMNINGKTIGLLTSSNNNDIISSILLCLDTSFQNETSFIKRKETVTSLTNILNSSNILYDLSNKLNINIVILNINGKYLNIQKIVKSSKNITKYIMIGESSHNSYCSIGLQKVNGISFIHEEPLHKLLNIHTKNY